MSGLKPSEQRKLEDGDYQNGDEIINKETQEKEFKIEENFSASANWVSLPQQMTLHLRVCKFISYETTVCAPLQLAICIFFTPLFSAVYNQEQLILQTS